MTGPRSLGIAQNITWLTAASLAVKPFWLVFVVVLCWRYLGTAEFGAFSTALWLAFIPAALTDLGLTSLTVRNIARARESASQYFSNILTFRLALSPVAWLIAVGAGSLLGYDRSMLAAVGWAGVYALALQTMTYVRSFYRAFENLRLEGISTLLEKLVVIAVGAIALFVTRSAAGTLAGIAVGMVIAVVMNVFWIHRNLARFELSAFSPALLGRLVRFGVPLFISSFAIMSYGRFGGVLLEFWHGEQAAGEFAAGYRILEALFLLNAVFTAAVMPRLSNLFHDRRLVDFRYVLSRSILAAVLIAVAIAAVVSLSAELIIGVINPDEPNRAPAEILAVLVWVLPLMTTKDLLVASLIASDQERILAIGLSGVLAISLALQFALTQPDAASGLTLVFFLSEALIITLCALQLIRTLGTARRSPAGVPEVTQQ